MNGGRIRKWPCRFFWKTSPPETVTPRPTSTCRAGPLFFGVRWHDTAFTPRGACPPSVWRVYPPSVWRAALRPLRRWPRIGKASPEFRAALTPPPRSWPRRGSQWIRRRWSSRCWPRACGRRGARRRPRPSTRPSSGRLPPRATERDSGRRDAGSLRSPSSIILPPGERQLLLAFSPAAVCSSLRVSSFATRICLRHLRRPLVRRASEGTA